MDLLALNISELWLCVFSAIFSFESRAFWIWPGQPVGREPPDRFRFPSVVGSQWDCRSILRLQTLSRLGFPVRWSGFIWRRSLPCPNPSPLHHLRSRPMPKWPLLSGNASVGQRDVVGHHTLCALTSKILSREQRGLWNHILQWRHSRWGVRVETTTICLWKYFWPCFSW